MLGHVAWSLLAALIPALVLEWLARRLLRRAYRALAARRELEDEDDAARADLPVDVAPQPADAPNAAPPLPVSPPSPVTAAQAQADAVPSGTSAATKAKGKVNEVKGKQNAKHHWTLLRRLPRALLTMVLRLLPLAVFVGAASALMSIFTETDAQDRALDSLVDIYVLCRVIVIVSGFFLQPGAPRLRLLRMSDAWAAFVQRWMVRIVSVVGAGSAVAEIAQSLGLNDAAHLALMKVVALAGHVMISILVLQCANPVGELIAHASPRASRWRCSATYSPKSGLGHRVRRDGAMVHLGARRAERLPHVAASRRHFAGGAGGRAGRVDRGVRRAGRLFNMQDDAAKSLVHQHAYRYYPLLRRVVAWLIGVVTALALLQVWGVHVIDLFRAGTIGHRLASAIITIGVAAAIALLVWEGVNVLVEQRLESWTTSGDLVRAARLRTLLPMLRSALFCAIALVVV